MACFKALSDTKGSNTILEWKQISNYWEAELGDFKSDGVRFILMYYLICYRRGQWRLLIEICEGENHYKWGCFDAADQPLRYYHGIDCAKHEAQAIADVLWRDRF